MLLWNVPHRTYTHGVVVLYIVLGMLCGVDGLTIAHGMTLIGIDKYPSYLRLIDSTMMTSSNGTIFRFIGPLCGEFTGHRWTGNSPVTGEFPTRRPVTRSFDVFFDMRPNKRLSKQSLGWWFETPSRSLWRQCNDNEAAFSIVMTNINFDQTSS